MLEHSKVDVVGVGLNATDVLIRIPHFPAFDTKVQFTSAQRRAGGQVATAIVACRRWGLRTRYIGSIGDDDAGKFQAAEFAREGVEAHLFEVPDCNSQSAFIFVEEESGERTIVWRRDPRLEINPDSIQEDWIVSARVLLVDGHDTRAGAVAARFARKARIPVVADVDNLYPEVEALLENIDYLISSKDFPQRLTGERNLLPAIIQIHERFKCRLTGATIGRLGVVVWTGDRFLLCPGFRVNAVDTTGAGDAFHAAFAYALLDSQSTEQALEFSCAAAALNCTAPGARGRLAPIDEIHALMDLGERSEPAYTPDLLNGFRCAAKAQTE